MDRARVNILSFSRPAFLVGVQEASMQQITKGLDRMEKWLA